MLVIKHSICLPAFPWHKWHPSLWIRFTPLFSKEIKPVKPKGNQSWILIGRTDTKVEPPRLWPPDATDDSLEKTLMLGKIEGRRRGWQDEMVGWHHRFNGHELGQTPGGGERQGGLVCCGPCGRKVGHDLVTEQQQHLYSFIPLIHKQVLVTVLWEYRHGSKSPFEAREVKK